jgi:HPt (histidine-containing phosphotransfer) domain-containing protein
MNTFKQLDTEAFEKYFGGFDRARSVGIYLKMSTLFLNSYEENVQKIIAYLNADDGKNAKIIAHRLKGALRTVGGTALAEVFFEIEQGEGNIPHGELIRILEKHRADSDQFIFELRSWMAQLHASLNGTSMDSV